MYYFCNLFPLHVKILDSTCITSVMKLFKRIIYILEDSKIYFHHAVNKLDGYVVMKINSIFI